MAILADHDTGEIFETIPEVKGSAMFVAFLGGTSDEERTRICATKESFVEEFKQFRDLLPQMADKVAGTNLGSFGKDVLDRFAELDAKLDYMQDTIMSRFEDI